MDKLKQCAIAFERLLPVQYNLIIGRKGQSVSIRICFAPLDFHHLMGLGKCKDLRIARQNRNTVFSDVLSDAITYETIAKSNYILEIENRFIPLAQIEQLLDSNELIFRYHQKQNQFSLISAAYLLSTPLDDTEIYIFIDQREDGNYFCKSFFPKGARDYTVGQTKYTLLYKEKVNLMTGDVVVQYDRLKKEDVDMQEENV